jgi:hypothetical protein
MQDRGFSSRRLAFMGILAALAVITLFLATILPTNRISLYVLSSFFVSIVIIEYGVRNGWLFYIASSLLALLIVQNKLRLVPYIIFFGLYGIIKYYIEKLNNMFLELVLKLIYFNVCLFTAYYFVKEILLGGIEIKYPLWVAAIILQVIFIVYDYVYSRFILYYRQKLRNIIKI